MKAEYDFSRDERGKFYHPEAEFQLPIYLEPDINATTSHLAEERGVAVQALVNEWLRANLKLLESVRGKLGQRLCSRKILLKRGWVPGTIAQVLSLSHRHPPP